MPVIFPFCRFPTAYPAASVRTFGKGKIAAIYFNSGTAYKEYKTFVVRDSVNELINSLMPVKIVRVTGSQLVHITVNGLNDKLYVNLINVSGEHTNENAIGYDEIPAIKDLSVSVQVQSKPARIILQPENKPLEYKYKDGKVMLTLPELTLNSILELE